MAMTMDFGEIKVTVETNGATAVEGPKAFVDQIDWDGVMRTAELFAPFSGSAERAVAIAVQQKYAAWKGALALRPRGR